MLEHLLNYEPIKQTLWKGRTDSLPGERFFQQVTTLDLTTNTLTPGAHEVTMLGFCSDEGIRRNEGRIGAKSGPLALREQLAKLACHSQKQLIDIGNIYSDNNLELAQKEFARLIHYCHQQGHKTIAFGGGHEIAWGHFLGLSSHYNNLGVINFDAHFDLRPLKDGHLPTSGTPFRQIADYCESEAKPFRYCCLGIQPTGNTRSLFEFAEESGVSYLSAEQLNDQPVEMHYAFLEQFLSQCDSIYLTICLDVFAQSIAPGVSAPQPLGLTPWIVLPLLKYIVQSGKVVSLDIAELSPPLDHEQQTSRLAANLVAELLDFF